jgi:hypothetical protein
VTGNGAMPPDLALAAFAAAAVIRLAKRQLDQVAVLPQEQLCALAAGQVLTPTTTPPAKHLRDSGAW